VALERVITRALQRPPCLVSFSGGHNSSLVLAAATRAARREHVPLSIPVTWRPTDAPRAEESAWQEAVVAALRLTDWIRLPTGDDLDFVGPVATDVLRRHGLLHPANAYFHAPLLKEAAGGTLLTGVGGDQVLGRLRRPRPPFWWPRRSALSLQFSWLHPAAGRCGLRREERARPIRYQGRPAWTRGRRDLELGRLSPAPTMARSPISIPHTMVALAPTEAPRATRAGLSCQSVLTARGRRSLVKTADGPTNTSSASSTPL
jgi:hypothetical protein